MHKYDFQARVQRSFVHTVLINSTDDARVFHSSLSREQFQTVKHGGAAVVTWFQYKFSPLIDILDH